MSLADRLDHDGFVIIPNFWSKTITKHLRARANELLSTMDLATLRTQGNSFTTKEQQRSSDEYFLTSGDEIRPFFEDTTTTLAVNKIGHALHELDFSFRTYSKSEQVRNVLWQAGLRKPVAVQSMYICKGAKTGGEVNAHQDGTFLITQPNSVIGLWWALQDATKENGCMYAIPGSHKTGIKRLFLRARNAPGTVFEPPNEPAWDLSDAVPLEAKEGSLIVLHGAVIHMSSANVSNKDRAAYSVHFVEADLPWHERNWLTSRIPKLPLFNRMGPPYDLLTINISSFCGGGSSSNNMMFDQLLCATQFDEAMRTMGVCIVKGHGIPFRTFNRLLLACQQFFRLPISEKSKLAINPTYGSSTYNAMGAEAVRMSSSSLPSSSSDEVDQLESLYFGENPQALIDALARINTQWAQELIDAQCEYRTAMTKVLNTVLRIAAVALGYTTISDASVDVLVNMHTHPDNSLKISNYVEKKLDTGRMGEEYVRYGPHTDFQSFTFLRNDRSDGNGCGMQVLVNNYDGSPPVWITVPYAGDDGIVVNAGDFCHVWSGGRWKSPIHRVVGKRNGDTATRISIPFFAGSNPDVVIRPIVAKELYASGFDASQQMNAKEWLDMKRNKVARTTAVAKM